MSLTLREHQKQAVQHIMNIALFTNKRGFLLADDTGLGKTYSAAQAMGRILSFYLGNKNPSATLQVLCPISVVVHWEESFKHLGFDLGKLPIRVLNYQKVKQLFTQSTVVQGKKTFKQFHVKAQPTFLILDEAHYLKNYTGIMHKRVLQLMEHAEFTLFLTATPAQSPLEVGYLQPILGFGNFFAWLHHSEFSIHKHPQFNHFLWTPNPRDTEFVASRIYGAGLGLRRRAEDLDGWPERQIEILPIRISSQEHQVYRNSLTTYMALREAQGARELSEDTKRLVEVGKLRETLSSLKVPHTVQAAIDILEGDKQVAIFCLYRASAQQLHAALQKIVPTGMLTGSESDPRVRDNTVQDFRWGRTRAIVFTVFEGINLEQPTSDHPIRIQLNHDLPWSGIQAHQVCGRCHRNKMRALIYNLTVLGTIDERVAQRVTERTRAISQLAGDKVPVSDLTEADMEAELFGQLPNPHAT